MPSSTGRNAPSKLEDGPSGLPKSRPIPRWVPISLVRLNKPPDHLCTYLAFIFSPPVSVLKLERKRLASSDDRSISGSDISSAQTQGLEARKSFGECPSTAAACWKHRGTSASRRSYTRKACRLPESYGGSSEDAEPTAKGRRLQLRVVLRESVWVCHYDGHGRRSSDHMGSEAVHGCQRRT